MTKKNFPFAVHYIVFIFLAGATLQAPEWWSCVSLQCTNRLPDPNEKNTMTMIHISSHPKMSERENSKQKCSRENYQHTRTSSRLFQSRCRVPSSVDDCRPSWKQFEYFNSCELRLSANARVVVEPLFKIVCWSLSGCVIKRKKKERSRDIFQERRARVVKKVVKNLITGLESEVKFQWKVSIVAIKKRF